MVRSRRPPPATPNAAASYPAHSPGLAGPPYAPAQSDWVRLVDLAKLLGRQKALLLAGVAIGVLIALLVTRATLPVYRASSSIEVVGLNEEYLDIRNFDAAAKPGALPAESYIQTQGEILQDPALVEQVVAQLHLELLPEYQRPPGVLQRLGRRLGLVRGGHLSLREQALEVARERLMVVPSRQSRIIRVSFDSADPALAAAFVNALNKAYIGRSIDARSTASAQVRQWLNPQLQELKSKVEKAETELQAYSRQSGLVFTGDRESVAEERLRQLQRDLAAAHTDRIARQSLYETAAQATGDNLPPTLDTTGLRELRARLTELRRQRAELDALFTPESQRVQRVQAQISELEAALQREVTSVPERARNEFEAARKREEELSRVYTTQVGRVLEEAKKKIRYNTLKHEADVSREMFDSMSHKVKEADLAAAIQPSNVRILSSAKPPSYPWRPSLSLNLTFGLGGGLCLGILLAAFRETVKDSVATPEDASALLQVPSLGAVPSASSMLAAVAVPLLSRKAGPVELATWQQKNSQVSESFREILASILFSGPHQVLLITSPAPADGKTTVACNLAIALGEIGRRVLVIDGDLRKPRLHRIFNLPNEWGLSDVLSGRTPIADIPSEALVAEAGAANVSVLPSGVMRQDIFQVLTSARLRELMDRVRTEFDVVLIDAPPVLDFADARLLGQVSDTAVLVLRANHTNRHLARYATERLEAAGIQVLGAILNEWDHSSHSYFYRRYRYRPRSEA
jgi:capsular exopolysaccharide synthesis family protein